MLVAILGFFSVVTIQNKKYEQIINVTISNIVDKVMTKYPETAEEEIIQILQNTENNYNSENSKILKKYGYTKDEAYIQKLRDSMNNNIKIGIALILAFGIMVLEIAIIYNKKRERKIKQINKYLTEINNGKYELKIKENGEDEITKNVSRIQEYASSSTNANKNLVMKYTNPYTPGVWDESLRSYLYGMMVTAKNTTGKPLVDINGYVDKDTEQIITRGQEV